MAFLAGNLLDDIWSRVVFFMEISDLQKLKYIGNIAFWRRFEHQDIVKDVMAESPNPFLFGPTSALLPHLHHIRSLFLVFTALPASLHNNDWVLSLPKTLVDIDWHFREAASVWVTAATPGELHFTMTSANGYKPLFLCDFLPNLKILRLDGDWDVPCKVRLLHQLFEPVSHVHWTTEMRILFVKKLPSALQELEIRGDHGIPTRFLPPNLLRVSADSFLFSSLTKYGGTRFDAASGVMEAFPPPPTLYESLKSFVWFSDFLPSPHTRELARFRNLQNLTITDEIINDLDKLLEALPHSLQSLDFSFRSLPPDVTCSAKRLEMIPRGLKSLTMRGCRWQNNEPITAHLPPNLSCLVFQEPSGLWDLEALFQSSIASTTKLTHLEIASSRFHLACDLRLSANFSWLPPTVTHLTLGLPRDLDRYEPFYQDWSPNLSLLHLTLLGKHLEKLSNNIASHLPQTLKSLTLSGVSPQEDFPAVCPRNLAKLEIDNSTPIPDLFLADLRFPSSLNTFQIGSIIYSGALFPPEWTEIDEKIIKDWTRRSENYRFASALPSFDSITSWPTSLISIRLSISITSHDPIWSLKHLKSLTVSRFKAAKNETPLRLHKLHVLDDIDFKSMAKLPSIFSELRDLSIPRRALGRDRWERCVTHLTHLEKLEWRCDDSPDLLKTLFATLPTSLTWIKLDTQKTLTLEAGDLASTMNLQYLDLGTCANVAVTEGTLRSLGRTLETVGMRNIHLESPWTQIAAGLADDLSTITPLDLIRVFCPLLEEWTGPKTGFFGRSSFLRRINPDEEEVVEEEEEEEDIGSDFDDFLNTKSLSEWLHHFGEDFELRVVWKESQDIFVKAESLGRDRLAEAEKMIQTLTVPFVQSLPRSLTKWTCWHNFTFSGSIHGSKLPPSLTSLDLRTAKLDLRDDLQLPPTITSLAVRFFTPRGAIGASIFGSLPQALKRFHISGSTVLREIHIKALPASLIELSIPHVYFTGAQWLPRSLEILRVAHMPPDEFSHLPSSLTVLNTNFNENPEEILTLLSLTTNIIAIGCNNLRFLHMTGTQMKRYHEYLEEIIQKT